MRGRNSGSHRRRLSSKHRIAAAQRIGDFDREVVRQQPALNLAVVVDVGTRMDDDIGDIVE